MEILVVDSMSDDGTRNVVRRYSKKYPYIRLLDNPQKIIPAAMNIGIGNSKGQVIMKIDSHASYSLDYITNCLKRMEEYQADNVGGIVKALPREDTLMGRAIVQAISHPFGVGNSLFRIGAKEPVWADTAFGGCYRKEVLERIGLYNENIARSEDVAINSRLRRAGGRILLVPEIVSYYYARSNFTDFWKHNIDNGFWITYPLKFGSVVFSWRHLIPLAFVISLIGSLILSIRFPVAFWLFIAILGFYSMLNVYFSYKIAAEQKNFKYFFIMLVTFISLHIGYGTGSLWGLLKIFVPKKRS